MENQIIILESEIAAINDEVFQLQQQEQQLEKDLPVAIYQGDPARFAVDAGVAAQALMIQQPQVALIKREIAALERKKASKEVTLGELQKEKALVEKRDRLAAGRSNFEAKIDHINKLGQSLEQAYFELKTIFEELNPYYRETQSPENRSPGWRPSNLINMPLLLHIPEISKLGEDFVLKSRPIDLYQFERGAQLREQALRTAEARLIRADAAEKEKQREARIIRRKEIERLEALLNEKKSFLAFGQKRKAEFVDMGSMTELTAINGYIKKLEDEISVLENQLNEVKAEDAAS